VIRLETARRDEGIASLRKCFSHQEFQLAQFIATSAEARQIVTLHVKPYAVSGVPQNTLKTSQALNGCRQLYKCGATKLLE
jgi:hypothetical protein